MVTPEALQFAQALRARQGQQPFQMQQPTPQMVQNMAAATGARHNPMGYGPAQPRQQIQPPQPMQPQPPQGAVANMAAMTGARRSAMPPQQMNPMSYTPRPMPPQGAAGQPRNPLSAMGGGMLRRMM